MTSAYAPARRMRLSVVGEPSDEPLPCVSVEPPPEPHAVILSAIVAASAPASNLRFINFFLQSCNSLELSLWIGAAKPRYCYSLTAPLDSPEIK